MADKKISQLTGATTPLAGTEVLPIVQGGSTVKVAVSDLTAGRAIAATSITVGSGRTRLASSYVADVPGPIGNNTGVLFGGNTVHPCNGTGGITNGVASLGSASSKWYDIFLANNVVIGNAGKGIDFSANAHAAGKTSELLNWYEEGDWTPTYTGWTTNPTNVYAKYTRIGRVVILNFTGFEGVSVAGNSEIGGLPFTSNGQQSASVAMKDASGNSPGVTAFGTIGLNSTKIQSMTGATFTGLYWAFSVSYIV